METEQSNFDEYREKIPGIDVFNPWLNKFETKHTHMTRGEIRTYKTPLLLSALNLFSQFKACGCLFNGVTQNQERPTILRAITLFSEWSNRMPIWEHENKKFL